MEPYQSWQCQSTLFRSSFGVKTKNKKLISSLVFCLTQKTRWHIWTLRKNLVLLINLWQICSGHTILCFLFVVICQLNFLIFFFFFTSIWIKSKYIGSGFEDIKNKKYRCGKRFSDVEKNGGMMRKKVKTLYHLFYQRKMMALLCFFLVMLLFAYTTKVMGYSYRANHFWLVPMKMDGKNCTIGHVINQKNYTEVCISK